ncbi:hypothetical protein Tsubulata_005643 [Turnera subulata]|uniref:Peptidase A1 domain-containing protein n=1 Tax=Turnera subulata TaxID=218843 RepID=A0A9Q0F6H9_9ROSI|nr:hypothetical protein Tsubulata_005643 [Turnera subulata]
MANALKRSAKRMKRIKQALICPTTAQAVVSPGSGDYLMKMSVGTPPVETLSILDTGSDLVWTQCTPCTYCFPQDVPLFDPKASSTYKHVTCDSAPCHALDESYCESGSCLYSYMFGDGSVTEGVLGTDTVTLGSSTAGQSFSLPDSIIGCGTNNEGNFDGTGVVGLGQGPVSLLTRMQELIDGKFSYCLVSHLSNHTSKMNFGRAGLTSGEDVHSTPLIPGAVQTFYYVRLEKISVGHEEYLPISNYTIPPVSSAPVDMIVDTGTTLTYLPTLLYSRVAEAVRDLIPVKPLDDPTDSSILCYDSKASFMKPVISMHFTDAVVRLDDINTFTDIAEDVVCFAFMASDDVAIYGNTQQMNFLVGFDVQEKTVSFKKAVCEEL